MNRRTTHVILAVVALLLASCGGDGSGDGRDEAETTSTDPGVTVPAETSASLPPEATSETTDRDSASPPGPNAPDEATGDPEVIHHLEPEDGLEEHAAADVIQVVETSDPRRVLVTFWAGPADCFGLVRATAVESEREIAFEVVAGRRPPVDEPCIAVARLHATEVVLEQPIGDRQVLDQSTPTEMPTAPDAYAQAAFDAWASGDANMLARLTSDEAFAVLEDRPWEGDEEWAGLTCEGAAGSTYCEWEAGSERLVLRVANEAATVGQPDAVVEASFSTSG